MFGSHKRILAIVLTVVTLLAMVVPVATAAPELLHGISITSPTSVDYATLNAWGKVSVSGDIEIFNTQVCNVEVKFYWIDQMGAENKVWEKTYYYQNLVPGLNNIDTEKIPPPPPVQGWWDLKVVAQEDPMDPKCYHDKWSDTEKKALLVDWEAPKAELVKPGNQPWMWKGGTFVTGLDFLLTGTAWDKYGVAAAWFELCPEGSWACHWTRPSHDRHEHPVPVEGEWIQIGNENADGIAQDAIPTPGVPGQWQATWNSTLVHDGFYLVRFCAEDLAGNSNCYDERDFSALGRDGEDFDWPNPWPDAHWIFVNNTFTTNLQAGWNLISTPLLPYNTDINSVLFHLIDHGTVESVWTMVYEGTPLKQVWKVWTPTTGPADTLTKIVDGQGYWIKMKANDSLTIVGTWTTLGDNAQPPEYTVRDGWNLIGYTHWGRPTVWPTDQVKDYLGAGLIDNLQALTYYDPWQNVWVKLFPDAPQPFGNMVMGKGYWLSVTEAGVIRF